MNQELDQQYLNDAIATLRAYKKLAERALEQLRDDEYFVTVDQESNSIGVIMKHVAGNMLSRWTNFLTTDGEKPDRNRDREFVIDPRISKSDLLSYWEKGWQRTFETLEALQPDDLLRTVSIRGETHTVVQAINRQLAHYPYHIGQIIFLAKHFRSADWKSLSIPKNKSIEFNKYLEQHPKQADHRFDTAASFNDAAVNDD
jgi:hypothetical protein